MKIERKFRKKKQIFAKISLKISSKFAKILTKSVKFRWFIFANLVQL